jgi:hypothetical protein
MYPDKIPPCLPSLLEATPAQNVNQLSHHQAMQMRKSTKNVSIVVPVIRPIHQHAETKGSSPMKVMRSGTLKLTGRVMMREQHLCADYYLCDPILIQFR